MSRLIGKDRTRRVEELLLRSFYALYGTARLVILLASSFFFLCTAFIALYLLGGSLSGPGQRTSER